MSAPGSARNRRRLRSAERTHLGIAPPLTRPRANERTCGEHFDSAETLPVITHPMAGSALGEAARLASRVP